MQALLERLEAFVDRYLLPYNAAWHQSVAQAVYPPPFREDLKALARTKGLWNLFLPSLSAKQSGQRLSNLAYSPLAEAVGRLSWCAEYFNCSAPDIGNLELLQLFATPAQDDQWLQPLLEGRIRSAFAMSEPDVALSAPTHLQTCLHHDGEMLVLNCEGTSSCREPAGCGGCRFCHGASPVGAGAYSPLHAHHWSK